MLWIERESRPKKGQKVLQVQGPLQLFPLHKRGKFWRTEGRKKLCMPDGRQEDIDKQNVRFRLSIWRLYGTNMEDARLL